MQLLTVLCAHTRAHAQPTDLRLLFVSFLTRVLMPHPIEAIAVNQQWAGHPGRLAKEWKGAELNMTGGTSYVLRPLRTTAAKRSQSDKFECDFTPI